MNMEYYEALINLAGSDDFFFLHQKISYGQ